MEFNSTEVNVGWQAMRQFETEWNRKRVERLEDMGSLIRGVTVHDIEREERGRLLGYATERCEQARRENDQAGVEAWTHLIESWCTRLPSS